MGKNDLYPTNDNIRVKTIEAIYLIRQRFLNSLLNEALNLPIASDGLIKINPVKQFFLISIKKSFISAIPPPSFYTCLKFNHLIS